MGMNFRGFRAALLALSIVAFAAHAARPPTFDDRAEASRLLRGTVDIRTDGTVERYALEDSATWPKAIIDLVASQVASWRFEPVSAGGKPVAARTNMSLRIVATPKADDNYDARIGSVWFSGSQDAAVPRVRVRMRTGLAYPAFAAPGSMAGTVYVALKIGPRGKVMDAIVEQVNLTTFGTGMEMAQARRTLGNNTVAAVRMWTFDVPTTGEAAGRAYWIGVLPVRYGMSSSREGAWERYLPGPRTEIPWANPDGQQRQANGSDIEALPAGVLSLDNTGPKLLTPLTQG